MWENTFTELETSTFNSIFSMGHEPSISLWLSHEQQLIMHHYLGCLLFWWVWLRALWYIDRLYLQQQLPLAFLLLLLLLLTAGCWLSEVAPCTQSERRHLRVEMQGSAPSIHHIYAGSMVTQVTAQKPNHDKAEGYYSAYRMGSSFQVVR